MKFTMFVTEEAIQFNLEPESEHEKEFLKMLGRYNGDVSIKQGADIGMSQAGYIRNFGSESKHVAITINKPEPKKENQ